MLIRAAIISGLLLTGSVVHWGARAQEVRWHASLQDLSLAFDGWRGAPAVPFDERTLAILRVDEYVHRLYSASGRHPISLYVGYYGSQRQGDTMHSPLNCLPGSGWQPVSRSVIPLDVKTTSGAARVVKVNELLIAKGSEQQVVLYWYQSRGEVTASEYWSKIFTVRNAITHNRTDGAIVRVLSPVGEGASSASRDAAKFAQDLFPELGRHLPH